MMNVKSKRAIRSFRLPFALVYLVAILAGTWFHIHPDDHHADHDGGFYHSHIEPFASQSTNHSNEAKHNDNDERALHLIGMQSEPFKPIIQVEKKVSHKKNTINSYFVCLPSNIQTHASFIITEKDCRILILQDKYVHFSTNLSPPLA
jgi:hypothetical protein